MPMAFETTTKTVGELFGDTSVYRAPSFQRPYAWEAEAAGQLFDDIQSAFNNASTVAGDQRAGLEFFLGTLIFSRASAGLPFEIVDGQQRLVTLSIILAVLRDSITDEKVRHQLQQSIWRPANDTRGTHDTPRIILREIDQKDYIDTVATVGGTVRPGMGDTDSARRICEAVKRIQEDLGKVREAYIRDLARYILGNVVVICVTTSDVTSAFKMFRSVNTYGQRLLDLDLARAELVGAPFGAGNANEMAACWDQIEDQIGLEGLRSYVATIAGLVRPQSDAGDLYEKLMEIFRHPVQMSQFRQKLTAFLSAFARLEEGTIGYGNDDDRGIDRAIKCLQQYPIEGWKPPAMLWLAANPSSRDSLRFFGALDALCLGLLVLGESKSKREKRFGKVQARVLAGDALSSANSELYLTADERNRMQRVVQAPIRSSKTFLKPLLLRLNAEMSDHEASPHYPRSVTLEHVLPQQIGNKTYWKARFGDAATRSQLVEKIGNYALLTHKINATAVNAPFPDKKRLYFGMRNNQVFALTAEISRYDDWLPDTIRTRTDELAGLVDKIVRC